MGKVQLSVMALSYSQTQTGAYALILSEENGSRRLPIIIGAVESQSIAIQLENIEPPRPLTHDLFKDFVNNFDIDIEEVNIHKMEDAIFYAEIICTKDHNRIAIDARPSDAIAIALRIGCPIYATEAVMEKAGVILQTGKEIKSTFEKKIIDPLSKYQNYSLEDLEALLQKAIEDENYEEASQLRDEIKYKSE